MRLLSILIAGLFGLLPFHVAAQGQFSPAITVNDSVITNFELSQRIKLLELFQYFRIRSFFKRCPTR